jgi:K+-transporting ATPase KdpF subunit
MIAITAMGAAPLPVAVATAAAIVAAAIAVALTSYLCVALLKPEWFE